MAKATNTPPAEVAQRPYFEEWEVKITSTEKKNRQNEKYIERTIDKLKIARPKVKITDEHAAILNDGVLHGNNTYAVMYFRPGATEPTLPEIIDEF
jgi:hypothetical protein